MRKYILVFLIFSVQKLTAQNNNIIINWETKKIVNENINLPAEVKIGFTNCDVIDGDKISYQIIRKTVPGPISEITCNETNFIQLSGIGSEKGGINIRFQVKLIGQADSTIYNLYIDEQKNIKFSGDNNIETSNIELISPFEEDFIAFQSWTGSVNRDTCCLYPAVKYDPCCNMFTVNSFLIYKGKYTECKERRSFRNAINPQIDCTKLGVLKLNKGKASISTVNQRINYLYYWQRPKLNKGAVFLIEDFNMLKYDITLSNKYNSKLINEPPLFKSLITAMSSGTGAIAKAGGEEQDSLLQEMEAFLGKVVKLDNQLQKFITHYKNGPDCSMNSAFNMHRSELFENIQKHLGMTDPLNEIEKEYLDLKMKVLSILPDQDTVSKDSQFNAIYRIALGGRITPDALVLNVSSNLFKISYTEFRYQYNIPQLKNEDNLVFTLNIKPKEEGIGTIHIHNQEIEIPIYGAWRMDFTSGFYYSSLRNESFGLRPVYMADTLFAKEIVENEGISSSTFGATGQMHLYRRRPGLQPTFNFGVGLGLNLNYSILLGGGLLLGEKHRVALSAGFNFSNVKVLASQYRENGEFVVLPPGLETLEYVNTIKTGAFISLTYSLSGTQDMKVAEGAAPTEEEDSSSEDGLDTAVEVDDSGKPKD